MLLPRELSGMDFSFQKAMEITNDIKKINKTAWTEAAVVLT